MAAITTTTTTGNPLATHEDRVLAASIALSTLRALGREDLIRHLTIDWSPRFTRALGKAIYCDPGSSTYAHVHLSKKQRGLLFNGRIVNVCFSSILWPRASKEERRETVIHEICHLVTFHEAALKGIPEPKAHGYKWKATMIRAGVRPNRCHSIDRTGLKRTTKTETAHCKCREHKITKKMAAKIHSGVPYICRNCHTNLKLGAKPAAAAPKKATVLDGWRIPSPAGL